LSIKPNATLKFSRFYLKGDQMDLWKKSPKVWPKPFLRCLKYDITFNMEKVARKLACFCNFQKATPK
jgi:hypothetical protein